MPNSDELDPQWHRISRFQPDEVDMDALLKLLNHTDWQVRFNAAREIKFKPDAGALDMLMTLFKQEQNTSVRHMVGLALDALQAAGNHVPILTELDTPLPEKRRQLALQRLRELKVQVKTDAEAYVQLMIPFELKAVQFLEIGYLMAQLTDVPFPDGYSPLAETVQSAVLPSRASPPVDFIDSYPSGMKFRIYRQKR